MKNFILISPFSRPLTSGTRNPKNYPFWNEVIEGLPEYEFIQIGQEGEEILVNDCRFNLPPVELAKLIERVKIWVSVDNFLPHMANISNIPGIVIWGPSDPMIYGYPQNKNLLKDRSYLRPDQFGIWDSVEFNADAFIHPNAVIEAIRS